MPRRFRPNRGGGDKAREQRRGKRGGRGSSSGRGPSSKPKAPVGPKRRVPEGHVAYVGMSEAEQTSIAALLTGDKEEKEELEMGTTSSLTMSPLLQELLEFGFRKEESMEASRAVGDASLEDALDWLCMRLPVQKMGGMQNELPESMHGRRVVGMKFFTGGELPPEEVAERAKSFAKEKRNAVVLSVAGEGWPLSQVERMASSFGECPSEETLRWSLAAQLLEEEDQELERSGEWKEEQEDEILALQAILGEERVVEDGPVVEVDHVGGGKLAVMRRKQYPQDVACVVWLHPTLRARDVHGVNLGLAKKAASSRGMVCIWDLVEWIEERAQEAAKGNPQSWVGSSLVEYATMYVNSPQAEESKRIQEQKLAREMEKKREEERKEREAASARALHKVAVNRSLAYLEEQRKKAEEEELHRMERIQYVKRLMEAEARGETIVVEKKQPEKKKDSVQKKIQEKKKDGPWGLDEQKLVVPAPPLAKKKEKKKPPLAKKKEKKKPVSVMDIPVVLEIKPLTAKEEHKGRVLLQEHRKRVASPQYQKMLHVREKLPAFKLKNEILDVLSKHQVVVVSGATGSGKTTQIGQFILDDLLEQGMGARANIVCTQPRRISATSVAERVAEERAVKLGDEVGYHIRLNSVHSSRTQLLFCTAGVLLRKLQNDVNLMDVSTILVDEIHERDLNSDFLLIILRDLLRRRKDVRIVLMSATLNAELFSRYFGGCPVVNIPGRTFPVQVFHLEDVLEMTGYVCEAGSEFAAKPKKKGKTKRDPLDKDELFGNEQRRGRSSGKHRAAVGKMFAQQIQERDQSARTRVSKTMEKEEFLDFLWEQGHTELVCDSIEIMDEEVINYELLEAIVLHIFEHCGPGAILVFLPGLQPIRELHKRLHACPEYTQQPDQWRILGLHSAFPHEEQRRVFDRPPAGVRKVVISTNIAETSVTIDDVVYVVDSGRLNEKRYDAFNRTGSLVETWCSKASALQRQGRAGRVQPGQCFRTYSSWRFDKFEAHQKPEMLRTPLHELALHVKAMGGLSVVDFISKAVEPPSKAALQDAVSQLAQLQAFENQEGEEMGDGWVLTALGRHLAALPMEPRLGKMIIFGAMLGCLDPILTIAASVTNRSPFVSPMDERDAADKAKRELMIGMSDHLTVARAYDEWFRAHDKGKGAAYAYCRRYYLSYNGLKTICDLKNEFFRYLENLGFVQRPGRGHGRVSRGGQPFDICRLMHDAEYNCRSGELFLCKAVLCAGLYPNVARVESIGKIPKGLERSKNPTMPYRLVGVAVDGGGGGVMELHPASVLFQRKDLAEVGGGRLSYLVYHERVKTSKVFVREGTVVDPYPLLFFGGKIEVNHADGYVMVGPIKVRAGARVATLIKHLRSRMSHLLMAKIAAPQKAVMELPDSQETIEAVVRLLTTQGK